MLEDYPSLLTTKLATPRLRSSNVERPHLYALLDSGLERKLTLIAAAAGFGKTTLLVAWASQQERPFAWLSLDSGDNDPIRFFSYLVAAMKTQQPQVGDALLAALQSPQPPSLNVALPILINQLTAVSQPLHLVLDDYHLIENKAIHEAITFLLEHGPSHLHLVLLSRTDPPLPLARLRASHELLEVRAAALRFTEAEVAQFFQEAMGVAVSTTAVHTLYERTEGWIAGLQLAAIALQTMGDDREQFVIDFSGSHRFVLDYLLEEVLARQPAEVRRFLLQTSVLQRLNGPLCSAVADVAADGQAMLEQLERDNLFLVPLDQARHWYRYHHLFADLLQARLQAEAPEQVGALQRRAAVWHEHNHLPQEAVNYALAAADFAYAAELIAGPAMATMQRGEVNTLLRWYEAFPSGFVAAQPALALQFGLAFALNGRWSEAEALLQTIEQTDDILPSTALMLAYLVASQAGDTERLTAVASQAAAHPQPDSLTTLVLGLVVGLTGDWARACQLMTEAQERSTREGDHTLALTALFHRCRLHVFGGELLAAYDACQQALQQVEAAGSALLPMTTFAHVSLGRIMIEWQQMDSAAEHLAQAIHGAEQSGFVTGILSSATMMLAEAKQAQGDTTAATQLAEQALAYAARYDPAAEVAWLRIYQVRLWLGQGKGVTAVNWLHTTREQYLPPSRFYIDQIRPITQARVLLAQHKYEEAIPLLTSLTTAPRHLLTVELFALLALARQAQGDSHHALLALTQALELAQTEKHQHVFMELGPAMTKLLTRFCEELAEHTAVAFARELLRIAAVQPLLTQAIDPLSQREREVLQLIVAGYSNQEIAETLTIASSTVKWYINTLYSKLQVKSRSQAIARSRELGLFTD